GNIVKYAGVHKKLATEAFVAHDILDRCNGSEKSRRTRAVCPQRDELERIVGAEDQIAHAVAVAVDMVGQFGGSPGDRVERLGAIAPRALHSLIELVLGYDAVLERELQRQNLV